MPTRAEKTAAKAAARNVAKAKAAPKAKAVPKDETAAAAPAEKKQKKAAKIELVVDGLNVNVTVTPKTGSAETTTSEVQDVLDDQRVVVLLVGGSHTGGFGGGQVIADIPGATFV